MGYSTAIIAPISNSGVEVPPQSKLAVARCSRLGETIEQFFDPFDIQSFVFDSDWLEVPGISRLIAKANKEFASLNESWPDWVLVSSSFGVYYPFFAYAFGQSGPSPSFELPVWPQEDETIGRYVHRFLTSSAAEIKNLDYSERGAGSPVSERSRLPIVRETLDLARRTLLGVVTPDELRDAYQRWLRMGVIRNAYHKPVTVILAGQDAAGSEVRLSTKASVLRAWKAIRFEVRLKPGQVARLNFRPPLQAVYLRSTTAECATGGCPLTLEAGGGGTLEVVEAEVQLFVPYTASSYVRFIAPADQEVHGISFEMLIRDDPVAQIDMIEFVAKGHK